MHLVWIAVGGGLGAAGRFALGRWLETGSALPWGTLTVNLLGSFALGFFAATMPPHRAPRLRAALTVGFCGGFTTFGAFAVETLSMLRTDAPSLALAYAGGSVVLCVGMVFAGILAASRGPAAPAPAE